MTIKTAWDARQKAEAAQKNVNIDWYLGYIDGLSDKGETSWGIEDWDEHFPNEHQIAALKECGFVVEEYNSHVDVACVSITWKNAKHPDDLPY